VIDANEKYRLSDKSKLKAMCRAYDERTIRILGGYALEETVDPHIRIEAIRILLDRGHGRPKTPKEKQEHSGTVNLVMRHIHEGKPPGEK
jgi:hypothetical protein